ncbi:hypothetical protein DRV85_08615 [Rhodosalinus halophilus]|uniref:SH3b domain-containing protein n=1 Tax=Rhodosalinus halophilus TaxID=2259333 RepID=A0A365UBE7_9RHOB|nr:SH3 domain-containing protein [Rhodosalinus halophilus]RBI85778.1 hypothetical protein DRV85_08615 [Rhodosalinus halophilus]
MWGFIIATFVLLAVVFYQASGGADYAPSATSIQAQERAPGPEERAEPASSGAVDRVPAAADAPTSGVPLASARTQPEPPRGFDAREPGDGGLFTRVVMPSGEVAAPQAPTVATPVVSASATDIRAVDAGRVNMRAGPGTGYGVLATLSRGDRVIVLDDPGQGWVKLRVEDGGRVGWMAASLLEPID